MTKEFKKISSKSETRYVLESMTSGGTGAGAIASATGTVGKEQKRGNLLAQEGNKDKVPAEKPRNFVAKNAKMGGAGQHKDKKKSEKQGNAKHKKPFMEGEVVQFPKKHKGDLSDTHDCPKCGGDLQGGKYMGHAVKVCMPCKQVYLPPNSGIDQNGNPAKEVGEDHEIQMASSELQSITKNSAHLLDLVRKYSEKEGLEAWQQSKITKAADYLNSVLQSISSEQNMAEGEYRRPGSPTAYNRDYAASRTGFGRRGADVSGEDEPEGIFTVMINGKPWKTATSNEAFKMAQRVANKYPDRQVAVKWPNGAVNTVKAFAVKETDSYFESLTTKLEDVKKK